MIMATKALAYLRKLFYHYCLGVVLQYVRIPYDYLLQMNKSAWPGVAFKKKDIFVSSFFFLTPVDHV